MQRLAGCGLIRLVRRHPLTEALDWPVRLFHNSERLIFLKVNRQLRATVWAIVFVAACFPLFGQKKEPSPEKLAKEVKQFPLLVEVSQSSTGISDPSDITCTETGGGKTDCIHNMQGGLPGERAHRPYAYIAARIDGEDRLLSCEANWVWSECRGLPPGKYHGQWANKDRTKMRVLVYYSGKKEDFLFKQTYRVELVNEPAKRAGAGPLPGDRKRPQ